ncbi:MAG: nucleotidyltransferase domain-containing protein [Pseudoxanthomonas sp.]
MDIHPIDPVKRAAVLDALEGIERDHEVRIVFACESGSRGWGFSSPDSDYDARFVYAHEPSWYLTVNEKTGPGQPQRDVIELPIDDELDVSGWDLRKALRLLSKSNPTLSEWLRSPIVYRQEPAIAAGLTRLADQFYSPIAAWHHYFSMAKGNYRGYLKGERVRTKKYLYVLRPVLACQWIEGQSGPPPMAFEILLDTLIPSGPLRDAIDALLAKKRISAEVGDGPRIPAISDFLEVEIERMQRAQPKLLAGHGQPSSLDDFLRSTLGQFEYAVGAT